jgi:5,10-methylenetetrahydromethanopterin reductase
VRGLLAGETVSVDGRHVRLDGVRLDHVPDPPPRILIGSTGPRGLAIRADGILIAEGAVPAAVRWARAQAGAPATTAVYAWLSVDEDRSAAATALRPAIAAWLQLGLYPSLREYAGLGDAAGDLEDDRIRALAVAGDARDCARALAELWAAGADTVVLVPRRDEGDEQLTRFSTEVRPLL